MVLIVKLASMKEVLQDFIMRNSTKVVSSLRVSFEVVTEEVRCLNSLENAFKIGESADYSTVIEILAKMEVSSMAMMAEMGLH